MMYHFNPYDANNAMVFVEKRKASVCSLSSSAMNSSVSTISHGMTEEEKISKASTPKAVVSTKPTHIEGIAHNARLPRGTLHRSMKNKVTFVPYPEEPFHKPEPLVPRESMVRLFLGQLPYQVTDMQLDWLCYTFGRGTAVYFPERITKHDERRGTKLPTGCIHAYCESEIAADLMAGLHKRLLIDDTGVWYAQTAEEQEVLDRYTQAMKKDRSLRFHNRPYDTVVTQHATSRYMPHKQH